MKKVREETTTSDIATQDLPIDLKKKKEIKEDNSLQNNEVDSEIDIEDVYSEESYYYENGDMASLIVLPNGDFGFLDEANNILISYYNNAYEINNLEEDSAFMVECICNLMHKEEPEYYDNNSFQKYRDDKDEYETFLENYSNLFDNEIEDITFSDFILLKKFIKLTKEEKHLELDKMDYLHYNYVDKKIDVYSDDVVIDYEERKITIEDKTYDLEVYAKKYLMKDADTIFDIVINNYENEEYDED